MSPGFTPRPLLSVLPLGVAPYTILVRRRVAGVHAPAFVERTMASRLRRSRNSAKVSPGFTPRPLLSGLGGEVRDRVEVPTRVAGVHAPAFVERMSILSDCRKSQTLRVSPGFTPRPLLSEGQRGHAWVQYSVGVSPGFTPRPLLSEPRPDQWRVRGTSSNGVAGVHAPAFVERQNRPREYENVGCL